MKNHRTILNLSLALLSIFLILTILVQRKVFTAFDLATTVKIQSLVPNFLVLPFSLFSLIGTAEAASLILLILMILFKKLRNVYVLGLFIISGLIELFGKSVIAQKGPPLAFLKTFSFFHVPSDFIPHEFFSYPSGHSIRTAFISALLIAVIWFSKSLNKNQKRFCLGLVVLFDILMFASRVYLGEHWATDVFGGALLGFFLASLAIYKIFK